MNRARLKLLSDSCTRLLGAILAASLSATSCAGRTPPAAHADVAAASGETTTPDWQAWTPETFARAHREHKLLLVSVQTSWCHFCHVMNDETFAKPEVQAYLREHFVVVRVDADARPDVAERYAEWGWPATALLSSDAQPIVNLRGFYSAPNFSAVLERAVAQGAKGFEHGAGDGSQPTAADPDLAAVLARGRAQLDATYDAKQGGWGTPQKYPIASAVEYAFFRARLQGDGEQGRRALEALDGYAQLIDPVWGGIFQYSINAVWTDPHYEKVHAVQASSLESFVQAYRDSGDPRWLARAQDLHRFVIDKLRDPHGAFYANQDADVGRPGDANFMRGRDFYARDAAARAGLPAPAIDQHVYANYDAMTIAALCELYAATLDNNVLQEAVTAYAEVERTHWVAETGGFAHDAGDPVGARYLSDQVEMARALLALWQATGDERYHERLHALNAYLDGHFLDAAHGGYFAEQPDPNAVGVFATPRKPLGDNARYARVQLRLAKLDGEPHAGQLAERALRAVGDRSAVTHEGRMIGEYLLALEELNAPYAVFYVVAPAGDATGQALAAAALHFYAPERLVERASPELSRYPYPGEPAVYLCSQNACSLPVTTADQVAHQAQKFFRAN